MLRGWVMKVFQRLYCTFCYLLANVTSVDQKLCYKARHEKLKCRHWWVGIAYCRLQQVKLFYHQETEWKGKASFKRPKQRAKKTQWFFFLKLVLSIYYLFHVFLIFSLVVFTECCLFILCFALFSVLYILNLASRYIFANSGPLFIFMYDL